MVPGRPTCILSDYVKMKQAERNFPSACLCLLLSLLQLHRLIDHTANGVRRLPLHPLGGVGVGVQGKACTIVPQGIRESFHIHTVLQGQRGEGMPEVC